MEFGHKTLGEILKDPRIRLIARDAVRNVDLTQSPQWGKTLNDLRREGFGGDLERGFRRLFAAAESGSWYYPLYTPEECAEDQEREGVNLTYFASAGPEAARRPYILLVPGGGFENVWSLTEGWPVAAQFNDLGYHVFILTYQVSRGERLMERDMEDFARAVRLIRDREKAFNVRWDDYITCGFSAGGYLTCLWNVPEKGWAALGLPGPAASFPVYPVVSLRVCLTADGFRPASPERFFGSGLEAAAETAYEIPDHAKAFPPCAIFLTAEDRLVDPKHSRLLAAALDRAGIPCRLEIGPDGDHGFADGTGMCMAGWTERAVRWFEKIRESD